MLVLLAACTWISDADHAARLAEFGVDTDDTDPPGDLRLDTVSPDYGTDAGGTPVVLTGGPFDDATDVYFGTAQANVVDVTADTLTVTTPASSVDGAVSITVSGGGGSAQKDNAFTYWEDATGQVGATGEFVWFYYAGGYWSESEEEYGRSTLRFTEPLDYAYYKNWAPELDTCVRVTDGVAEYEYVTGYVSIDARGGTVTERADGTAVDLAWNAAEERFTAYDIDPAQYVPGASYDLLVKDAPGLPAVEMADVFHPPDRFQVSEPAIFGASLPNMTEDQHFAWTTDETGDAVVLQLGMVNATNDGFEEEIYCALRDVGSFTVPDGTWTRWAPGRFMNILIARYTTGDGVLPWNEGAIGTASATWFYGAANTR